MHLVVGSGGGDDNVHPGRKRRREGGEGRIYRLYSPERQVDLFVRASQDGPPRKTVPLSKRLRIADDEPHNEGGERASPHRRRPSQPKVPQDHTGLGSRAPPRTIGVLLSHCHICHRRPTKKSDLDSFAECQGCGKRTCFVCIRECRGWRAGPLAPVLSEEHEMLPQSSHMDDVQDTPLQNPPHHQPPGDCGGCGGQHGHGGYTAADKGWDACGHRAVVCSRCCIEKGGQGDVVCLGCLSGMPGA
ncbi:hypothetical protein G6O67_001655 [Ophiocordyceps sinensis]|uniref:Uncharacterized protein n=1 Tax=Ophiocordyceps sinensis TaxID=72228 RepID=A0A8H4PY27_9HYPO|nr:hypothetical protein G6O67_001655 [Ophiocordyceps sinensis]